VAPQEVDEDCIELAKALAPTSCSRLAACSISRSNVCFNFEMSVLKNKPEQGEEEMAKSAMLYLCTLCI
jgi:hypothetical protein